MASPFDRHSLDKLAIIITRKQQIGDLTGHDLYNQSILTSGDEVVHLQMAFSPAEKVFNVPGLKLKENHCKFQHERKLEPELPIGDFR